MGIIVVGAVTNDTLIFPQKNKCRITESLGGILYTTIALASLTHETIYPVCNIGYDVYQEVIARLKSLKNVDLSYIQKITIKNIHCYILFANEYGTQYDEGEERPISFEQVAPLISHSKFIFVSPMTGFDIELATFKEIRQKAKRAGCWVYFDYHILSLGRDKIGNRFLHKRCDWFEWCTICDFLQLNKFEAELLYEKEIKLESDALSFSEPILKKGVKATAITLGSNGAIICYYDRQGNIRVKHLRVDKVDSIADATGCGDVFAAGFISHFMKTENILEAYKFANKIASLKVKISGINELSKLIKEIGVQ